MILTLSRKGRQDCMLDAYRQANIILFIDDCIVCNNAMARTVLYCTVLCIFYPELWATRSYTYIFPYTPIPYPIRNDKTDERTRLKYWDCCSIQSQHLPSESCAVPNCETEREKETDLSTRQHRTYPYTEVTGLERSSYTPTPYVSIHRGDGGSKDGTTIQSQNICIHFRKGCAYLPTCLSGLIDIITF